LSIEINETEPNEMLWTFSLDMVIVLANAVREFHDQEQHR